MANDKRVTESGQSPGNPLEGRSQVDPLLAEGRASRWRVWAIAIGAAVIAALVLYAVAGSHTGNATGTSMQLPSGPSHPPTTALPGGRGTGHAPMTAPAQTESEGRAPAPVRQQP